MKRAFKWVGLAVLLSGVLFGAGLVACAEISASRQEAHMTVHVDPPEVPAGEAALQEGHRLYMARGCGVCHGEHGEGAVVMDAAPGRIVGRNLTTLGDYAPRDYARAVRHGVARDGRPLVFMPSEDYTAMSNADLGHIVAYVSSLPPVEDHLPPTEVRLLGSVLHVLGAMNMLPAEDIDQDAARPPAPVVAETAEFGAYLIPGCTGCHGAGLSGGPIPGAPEEAVGIPSNITPDPSGIQGWTRAQFLTLMREGKRPDGSMVNTGFMPVRTFGYMTDVELGALYLYLQQVPPKPSGQR